MKARTSLMVLVTTALLVVSGLFSAQSSLADPAQIDESEVGRFADGSLVDGASSMLVRTDDGVTMTIHTSDLEPGAAYTVWWVIFNDPAMCSDGVCGMNDLLPFGGSPAVMSSVVRATGHVIGNNGVGDFAAHLEEGNPLGQVLFGPGLLDARGAEIHLVVRSHGQPIPGLVDEQISMFNGGCKVNTCTDVQFTIHQP